MSVFPFPANRRVRMLRKLAAQLASADAAAAQNILSYRLANHARLLARKGIEPADIARDVRGFEAAARRWIIPTNSKGRGT